jgi:hypothetical protein
MLICGYDDSKQALLILNSWGTGWGMSGFGWLPYQYVTQGLVRDSWVISGESGILPTPTPPPTPPPTPTPSPSQITLTTSNAKPYTNQSVTFTATLTDSTGKVIPSKSVSIFHTLNGTKYVDITGTTNTSGQLSLTQTFGSAGQRTYSATFVGDTTYAPSTSGVITIDVSNPPVAADGTAPSAVSLGTAIYLFVRGTDNALWYKTLVETNWHSLGGILTSSPFAIVSNGTIIVFVRGSDKAVYSKTRGTNGIWGSWVNYGGQVN